MMNIRSIFGPVKVTEGEQSVAFLTFWENLKAVERIHVLVLWQELLRLRV